MQPVRTTISRRDASVLAAAFLLVAAGASPVLAAPELATLKVVDRDTGEELPVWRRHGRLFVAGEPNARYGLRVTNNTGALILAVLSVDGVNVVTGETAAYNQGGYVLAAYETVDVTGWRKSTTEVAAFNFTTLPRSYAAETGRPNDVGVIGVAVFKSKPEPPTLSESFSRRRTRAASTPPPPLDVPAPPLALPPVKSPVPESIAPPAPVAPAPPAPPPYPSANPYSTAPRVDTPLQGERLGTAHGAREWSFVTLTSFQRATPYPQFVRQIEYDSYPNLEARGVIPRYSAVDSRPRPFPSTQGSAGFVPDPPDEP